MSESDLELYGIVGKMLREVREEKGYSLESGAGHLSIAPKSLQRYECGERKIKIDTIKNLCEFYNIDYYEFISKAKERFMQNSTNTTHNVLFSSRDNRDIKKDLDSIMEKLASKEYGPAAYDGEDLSEESAELFRSELEIALKRLKLMNKEIYNPNKNKK